MGIKKKYIIIQCRVGSKRLPNKILLKINNKYLIEFMIKNLKRLGKNYEIIICAPDTKKDKIFKKISNKLGIKYYFGSEKNVLQRYYFAAKKFNAETIIRLTSDCPLIDINLIKKITNLYEQNNYDYVSNVNPPTFPDGMDVEVFNFKTLKSIYKATDKDDKEHVTKLIRYSNNFKN